MSMNVGGPSGAGSIGPMEGAGPAQQTEATSMGDAIGKCFKAASADNLTRAGGAEQKAEIAGKVYSGNNGVPSAASFVNLS